MRRRGRNHGGREPLPGRGVEKPFSGAGLKPEGLSLFFEKDVQPPAGGV